MLAMVNRSELSGKTNRRTVIKGISGIGATTIGITGANSAHARNGKKSEFVGYTYNPITNEIGQAISAQLARTPAGIRGVLNLPNRKVPVLGEKPKRKQKFPGDKSPHKNGELQVFEQQLGGEFTRNGTPMTVKLLSGNGITGYVTNQGRTQRTTFLLRKVDMHGSRKSAHDAAKTIIGPTLDIPERIIASGGQQ